MLSTVLFRRDLRENYKLLLIFTAVVTVYSVMVVTMFDPALGQSLNSMAANMEGVFSAFGMDQAATTMIGFLANYLYGFLLIVIPLIFTIILSGRLIARHVSRGSMAYLLSAPCSRGKLMRTQVVFMILSMAVLVAVVTGICILCSRQMFPGALELKPFLILNAALLGLLLAVSALCLFFSCLFNDSRKAAGCSSAVVMAFVLFQMASSVGEKFEFLKYATPLTLFDPMKIIGGGNSVLYLIVGFYLAALVLFILSGVLFSKRNLPI